MFAFLKALGTAADGTSESAALRTATLVRICRSEGRPPDHAAEPRWIVPIRPMIVGSEWIFVLSDACSPLKVGTYNGLRILWITALSPQGGAWK